MSADDSFLGTILDAPDDDAPRLVYADYLEERGDPRGEFIRVQCELSRLPADDKRRPELEARELQLLANHRKEWTRDLRPWVSACEFRRGFVESIKLRADVFLSQAKELFRLAPLRHVHLVNYADHAAVLANTSHLAGIRSLALTDSRFTAGQRGQWDGYQRQRGVNALGTESLRLLLNSRHLKGLRALEAQNHCLGAAGAQMLSQSPCLARLEALDLRNNDFEETEVHAILGSRPLPALRELRLGSCFSLDHYQYFPQDGVGLFPREIASCVGQLRLLDVGSCGMTVAGLHVLSEAKRSVPLTALLLERSRIQYWTAENDPPLDAILGGPLFGNLRVLDVSSCYVNAATAATLVQAPFLAELVHLALRNHWLGAKGAAALGSVRWDRLTRLDLSGPGGHWSEEVHYESGENYSIKDEGLQELASSPGFPRLAALDLRQNQLTAAAVVTLAESALGAGLYRLDLRHNRLGNEGAKALLHGDWPRLAWLDVRDNRIGPRTRQALRQRFGHAVRY